MKKFISCLVRVQGLQNDLNTILDDIQYRHTWGRPFWVIGKWLHIRKEILQAEDIIQQFCSTMGMDWVVG